MPNNTVPAAATGLPNSRRAVLRSILAAGAVTTIPAAGAIATTAHPDAELFVLRPDIEAADRLEKAAWDVQAPAEDAYFAARAPRPAKPENVDFTNEEWFLTFKEKMAELNASPSPEIAAAIASAQAWAEEDERLKVESGLAAAEERTDEAVAQVSAIRDRIVATRATTLDELKFRAKYASEHVPTDCDQDVMDSIVDDLPAMS